MSYYSCITFLCWLFGGWFGLHHFYLGRDGHGFLWATSLGGFVIGWMRDLSRILSYTKEANNQSTNTGLSYFNRGVGMFFFGIFYRRIFINAIPEELFSPEVYNMLVLIVGPIGTTLALYLVSNIGVMKCKVQYPLIGSYIGEVLFGSAHILLHDSNVILVSVFPILLSLIYGRKRNKRVRRHFCWRLIVWGGLGALFCLMWSSYLYYNVEVHVEELDQDVKLRVVLSDLFNSPEWQELMSEIKNLVIVLWESGGDYSESWFLLQEGLASSRIKNSLRVMEFNHSTVIETLTETEITKKYRELVRKWHPDKHPSSEKDYAQEKFIEIQEAYKVLKQVVKRKSNKTEL